jgi:preprotein translocase subunit SecE
VARDVQVGAGAPRPRPEPRPAGEVQPHEGRRGGPLGFIAESWAELQKVEWPKQNQVIQGTIVVIVACIIVGVFLYLNDELWKNVVQKLFLK